MELLARNIRYLISQSKKTQADIAKDIGKNKSNLSNWAKGYAKPGLDDFVALVDYFQVSADELLFKDIEAGNGQVQEPQGEYKNIKNDAHLQLLIESLEIRIEQSEDHNELLIKSNRDLKASYERLQGALKANYLNENAKEVVTNPVTKR